MAGYLKEEKLLPSLLERMEVLRWNSIAKSAIIRYGDSSITALSSYFDNKDVHYLIKIDIIDILAKIGTEKSIHEIARKATNFQRDVLIVVLGVLENVGYKIRRDQKIL